MKLGNGYGDHSVGGRVKSRIGAETPTRPKIDHFQVSRWGSLAPMPEKICAKLWMYASTVISHQIIVY